MSLLSRFHSKNLEDRIAALESKVSSIEPRVMNYYLRSLGTYTSNTTKTYTIPDDMWATGGMYLLTTQNNYGATIAYILSVDSSSSAKSIVITSVKERSGYTVNAVANNPKAFSLTTSNVTGNLYLTRIA